MKPATIPKSEPAECPQIPERRRFLHTVLFASTALAAGCKSKESNPATSARLFQNHPFPLGSSSLTLKECSGAEQTATFEVSRPGNELPDSVTLRIPGSFTVSGIHPPASNKYEIYVESISRNAPNSADVSILESTPAKGSENTAGLFSDLPAIGAAVAFFGAVAFWITHRRKPEESEGTLLGPRGGKTTTI
ncbi:MAG: hypothetical protein WC350_02620 [Candidatus Micrarchaeia archaeon]|jgi:hypothetical protein